MKRKLVKVGNSLAVTLPSELVKGLKLEAGAEVEVSVAPSMEAVSVRFEPRYYEGGKVTAKFKREAQKMLDEYAELWKRLA
jgi:antitoxin component of MazEF toxin-antitoxin module